MTKFIEKNIPNDKMEQAELEIIARRKEISFFMTEYNIQLINRKMQDEEFIIPDYQREFTWDDARQSRFIESVIIGLPIPFLFFWETPHGTLEIVDGSQRLRTIHRYITSNLKLKELDSLPSLNGTIFSDLSKSRQLKIQNISIRGVVLNEGADESVRFDMFDRINTGSYNANPSEIRRGILRGKFQSLVEELAELPLFNELAPVSNKARKERIREEMISRFFAYGDGLENYKDSPSQFIFDYVKKMNSAINQKPNLYNKYKDRFSQMLSFINNNFPYGFKKNITANTTPRVRFESISIGVDKALQKDRRLLSSKKIDTSWLENDDFKKLITSDAANVKSKIIARCNYVEKKVLDQI